ncbi:hypothetical protein SLS58_003432 [Diplodia intermedia]|uniref:WSC domain-containing protein n=1 Tax=Diplodia intermedia TaxID=856260 RepID=A0ABR3TWS6_9PEZI
MNAPVNWVRSSLQLFLLASSFSTLLADARYIDAEKRQEATPTSTAVSTAAPACPGSDGVTYELASGSTFLVECSIDRVANDLKTIDPAANFAACIAGCDATANCKGVSYTGGANGGPCYLKSAVGSSSTNAGVWGAQLVAKGSAASSSAAASSTAGPTGSASSSTTRPASSSTARAPSASVPAGWELKGCYVDSVNARAMNNLQPDDADQTVESCVNTCIGLGYSVAGMEYGVQCFCDNYLRNGASEADSGDCSMACPGDSSEKCGAGDRLSIWSNDDLKIYQPPAAQNTSLPGNWEYVGCLLDSATARTFPYELVLEQNNTAENCLSQCSKYGYAHGGMEYGTQCYCGDASDIDAAGATLQDEADCNMGCSGNATYICGAGNRISYYRWGGDDPLYVWDYPEGNDAGEYSLLIGGVVIPLVSIPARNGKVVFVEKFGTGPGNSTGAYELDPTLVDDFSAAWRTMHVKTDVFCSGGVVLPDRAGRLLNVGGWSADSLEGVRLYWPDGVPGTAGTNDWEENVSELALQVGRWYPSAMVMANGSVLVVGGEDGSNGPPVPNMEVLPRPAGGHLVDADFLSRTDPYSTYPFLAVLPSGGIFISYYNEARILDENSLTTIKELPNIPGAVNNFLGGRTYPFEGTAVLFPQYAPYTDPLRVLICGGSAPGQAPGLDNCVHITPDAPEDGWTIERMPSKRVISCMTALPDGTYLILNGASRGEAGFGLATGPNLNAVLYDPSKPLHQRFSVMANTTVARMYHSEATLMDDGRVVVSGSDPQDDRYPQEYRIEVFTPPYILSGAARPTFTVSSNDWAYGDTVTFTLTSATTGNIRVSLLGAVTSTHGNSMGQRTFFPAVSCSGTTCTVTAPPGKYVCPPGWFQVFVLDGPTPSHATWVRIGGDPAQLGEWPAYDDFTTPGLGEVLPTTDGVAESRIASTNVTRRG